MPAGYVIAQLKITNPENYKEYIEKVSPIIKKYTKEGHCKYLFIKLYFVIIG